MGAHPSREEARIVDVRGTGPRAPHVPFDPASPVGRVHHVGTTRSGNRVKCAVPNLAKFETSRERVHHLYAQLLMCSEELRSNVKQTREIAAVRRKVASDVLTLEQAEKLSDLRRRPGHAVISLHNKMEETVLPILKALDEEIDHAAEEEHQFVAQKRADTERVIEDMNKVLKDLGDRLKALRAEEESKENAPALREEDFPSLKPPPAPKRSAAAPPRRALRMLRGGAQSTAGVNRRDGDISPR